MSVASDDEEGKQEQMKQSTQIPEFGGLGRFSLCEIKSREVDHR